MRMYGDSIQTSARRQGKSGVSGRVDGPRISARVATRVLSKSAKQNKAIFTPHLELIASN